MAKKLLMVMLSAVLAIGFFSCSMFNDDDDDDESANSTAVYTLSDIIGTTFTYELNSSYTMSFSVPDETHYTWGSKSYECTYTKTADNTYTITKADDGAERYIVIVSKSAIRFSTNGTDYYDLTASE